jgi:hypothetical protein
MIATALVEKENEASRETEEREGEAQKVRQRHRTRREFPESLGRVEVKNLAG